MLSIANLSELPGPDDVRGVSQSLAFSDAILSPEWENRFFFYNSQWNIDTGEAMASFRDGSGSEYFILFTTNGAIGKVYSADFSISYCTLSHIPDQYVSFKKEPAFDISRATYYFWWDSSLASWCSEPNSISRYDFLAFLAHGLPLYSDWAERYYERKLDIDTLSKIFTNKSLSTADIYNLNPDVTLDGLAEDIAEILGSK